MSQVIQHLLLMYKTGGSEEKPIKKIIEKEDFPIMYPTKCRRCGKRLDVGERVYYLKYIYEDGTTQTYILCQDCYLEGKPLARYYRKKKELEVIIKQLKKEADRLAEKVTSLERFAKLADEVDELHRKAIEFYKSFTKEVMDAIADESLKSNIMKGLEDLQELLDRLSKVERQLGELTLVENKAKKVVRSAVIR